MASRMKSLRCLAIVKIVEQFRKSNQTLQLSMDEEFSDDDACEDESLLMDCISYEYSQRLHGARPYIPRLQNYAEEIVPTYSVPTFRSHFRITPSAMTEIENLVSPILARQGPVGRFTIPPRKQLLSIIWLLATPDSYRSVSEQFGMNKGVLHHCFRRVIHALCGIVKTQIYWPQGPQIIEVKEKFRRISGMPNILGAIDGCQVHIDAPQEEPVAYRTSKKTHAMQLQAVCTADLVLTDIFTGYPGTVHDARVFKNSPLYRDANTIFQGDDYIIGDKAYPVLPWCIPPYKNYGNLTERELEFNKKLSATRQVIERCFSLLKGRLRRLKHLCMQRTDEIPLTIMACCVLHNICLRGFHDAPEHIEEYINDGHQPQEQEGDHHNDDHTEEGITKRNHLRDLLCRNNQ